MSHFTLENISAFSKSSPVGYHQMRICADHKTTSQFTCHNSDLLLFNTWRFFLVLHSSSHFPDHVDGEKPFCYCTRGTERLAREMLSKCDECVCAGADKKLKKKNGIPFTFPKHLRRNYLFTPSFPFASHLS